MSCTRRSRSKLKRFKCGNRLGIRVTEEKRVNISFFPQWESFPLVAEPAVADIALPTWAESHLEFIANSLLQYGGILFRGFKIHSVAQY